MCDGAVRQLTERAIVVRVAREALASAGGAFSVAAAHLVVCQGRHSGHGDPAGGDNKIK